MRIKNIFLLLSSVLLVSASLECSLSYAGLPSSVNNQPLPSIAPMLEAAMPAVVNISTTKNIQVVDNPLLRDPFFRHFFQVPDSQQRQQKNS